MASANLNSMIQLVFSDVPVSAVIQGDLFYDAISLDTMASILKEDKRIFQKLTDTEGELRVRGMRTYLSHQIGYPGKELKKNALNVFDMLCELSGQILRLENDVVVCHYKQIHEWRRLVEQIGEEIPVTMKYAVNDMIPPGRKRKFREDFSWDYVIRQNNNALNCMLEQGISEHHFHLWASAPYSQISWLKLMNRLTNRQFSQHLIELEERNLFGTDRSEYDVMQMDSLLVMHLQAALIRLYLCNRLAGTNLFGLDEKKVKGLLVKPQELYMFSAELESIIEVLQNGTGQDYMDYATRYCPYRINSESEESRVLSGERWFIYSNIQDMYSNNPKLTRYERNLFFAYLLIQTNIRSKLVQMNDKVGFDNFQGIQRRKNFFLNDHRSERLIARMAVRNPLVRTLYFKELEVRISPADTAERIRQNILGLERAILMPEGANPVQQNQLQEVEELLSQELTRRYYYVLSFLKREDKQRIWLDKATDKELEEEITEYRHYKYRKQLEKQTMAIIEFRETYPLLGCRVRGIDACSKEVGCRPENFASIFRMLHHHSYTEYEADKKYKLPKLGMTFHVAEEFIDIVDGLRAIDEAVNFLNMETGDRLGHALVLGVDVESWCESKNNQMSIPRQDYLDNLAWLHHAIRRYQIKDQDAFLRYIEKEFEQQFNTVYQSNMDEKVNEEIMLRGENYYKKKNINCGYKKRLLNFTIQEYYHAWTLRGDHPDLYVKGFFANDKVNDQWGYYKVNREYPRKSENRYVPECSLLYYHYHYNNRVKKDGNVVIQKKLSPMYIDGVTAVQKAFRKEIAQKNLAVEVNPTSNVKIGTFREYGKHPARTLYNNHLVHTKEELHECPQIQISINTDDNGVFFTSLENEFALMARAMEMLCDENKEPLYNFMEIKAWLNDIRQMGNEQGFRP